MWEKTEERKKRAVCSVSSITEVPRKTPNFLSFLSLKSTESFDEILYFFKLKNHRLSIFRDQIVVFPISLSNWGKKWVAGKMKSESRRLLEVLWSSHPIVDALTAIAWYLLVSFFYDNNYGFISFFFCLNCIIFGFNYYYLHLSVE